MIEIRTLGAVEVRDTASGQRLEALHHPRPLGLLVRLALQEGPVWRDTLLPLFWPESDEVRARHALRQLILRVRQASADLLVSLNSQAVQLREGAVRCDAVAVRQAVLAGRREEALHMYTGEFMAGFHVPGAPEFEDWLDRTRRELRGMAVEAARGLMQEAATAGRITDAHRCGERLLELEPYDEACWREYLLLLARAGQSGRALATFRRLEERMEADLEIQPSEPTLALARRLWPGEPQQSRVARCAAVAPVTLTVASAGREWRALQEEAAGRSRRTLEAVKQRSGLPFEVTLPRRSCLRHLERFLRSAARATAFIGPAGCGKSIALAHAAERLWLGREPAYPADVVWYAQAEDLRTGGGRGFDLPGWLSQHGWCDADEARRTFLASHPVAVGGRVILLLDGLDGHALEPRTLDALIAQLLSLVASSRHTGLRVVVAMRAPGWQRLAARVESASALAQAWYGVRWGAEEEDLRNVPLLRRSEVRQVIQRWYRDRQPSGTTLAEWGVTPMLREPGYLQLLLQSGFPSVPLDEGRLVESYLGARVFAGPDGAARAELLAEFLRLGRYGTVSAVERRRLRSRPRRRVAAYDDLLMLGVLRERQHHGDDGLPVAVVTAGQPQVLDYLVVRHWIAVDGGLTADMMRRLAGRYAGTTHRIELLEWVARIAVREGAFAALEEIFELPLAVAELDHLARTLGCLLRQHDAARTWLLPRWAQRSSGRRHYFESFVDQDYLVLQLMEHLPAYVAAATDRQARVFGHAMMLLGSLLRLDSGACRAHAASLDALAPDADIHPLPLGRAMAYRMVCHHLLDGAVPAAMTEAALDLAAVPVRTADRFGSFPVYHLFLAEALNLCGMPATTLEVVALARRHFPQFAEHRDRTVFYRLLLTHEAMALALTGRAAAGRQTLLTCTREHTLHGPQTYPSFHYAVLHHRLAAAEINARMGEVPAAAHRLQRVIESSRTLGFALFETLAAARLAQLRAGKPQQAPASASTQ